MINSNVGDFLHMDICTESPRHFYLGVHYNKLLTTVDSLGLQLLNLQFHRDINWPGSQVNTHENDLAD